MFLRGDTAGLADFNLYMTHVVQRYILHIDTRYHAPRLSSPSITNSGHVIARISRTIVQQATVSAIHSARLLVLTS